MADYLLYHKAASVTGPALAEKLGIRCGRTLSSRVGTLIRYGTSKSISHRPGTIINNRDAIARATNKRRSLEIFRERGLTAPLPEDLPASLPAIARKVEHRMGRGFWLCLQLSDVQHAIRNGASYFIPYIPTRYEYRVHVCGGRALFMQLKCLGDDGRKPMWPWLRNVSTGWKLNRREPIPAVCELGIAAVDALGLDFGAADILESDVGTLYILEVNTSPALQGEKIDIWAAALRRLMPHV